MFQKNASQSSILLEYYIKNTHEPGHSLGKNNIPNMKKITWDLPEYLRNQTYSQRY